MCGEAHQQAESAVFRVVERALDSASDQRPRLQSGSRANLDIYEDPYLVYIVMEYLGGGDLRSRIVQNGAFSGRIEAER